MIWSELAFQEEAMSQDIEICFLCKIEKPVNQFSKNKRRKNSLQARCKSCNKIHADKYRKENVESISEYHKQNYLNNRDSINERNKKWSKNNRDAMNAAHMKWRKNPDNMQKDRDYSSAYSKRNKDSVAAHSSNRRARQFNATPSWANKKYIKLFYTLASKEKDRTGEDVTVDHMVPLKSDVVCGLHVEANLQLMIFSENSSKGNRSWPNMWEIE